MPLVRLRKDSELVFDAREDIDDGIADAEHIDSRSSHENL